MATTFFEFFRRIIEGKKYIPEEARRKMKPHYDAIHNYEKEIKRHYKEIGLIREHYGVPELGEWTYKIK